MKKKYTTEEKIRISKEAVRENNGKIYGDNVSNIALKYELHISTVYSWIDKYQKKKGRTEKIDVRFSVEEKRNVLKMCEDLGYGNDVSTFVRRLIFDNTLAFGNPSEIVNELYENRSELNKIGSNLNQIANYTNFLFSQGYNDGDYSKDFKKYTEEMNAKLYDMRDVLDRTIKKIYK